MANLLQIAKRLALAPPLQLYTRMMQISAKEQTDAYENEKKNTSDPSRKTYFDQLIEQAKTLPQKYDTMKKAQGKSVADFSVNSICDLIAMSLAMTAAGIGRIEKLKENLRTASKDGDRVEGLGGFAGDHAHLYTRTPKGVRKTKNDLVDVFDRWCALDGNGVIQIKFVVDDAHTFAIERAPSSNTRVTDPVFIVYQAYQNTYSLQDFFGLRSTAGFEHDLEYGPWADMTAEQQKKEYGNKVDNFIGRCTQRLRMTRQVLGRGQELDKPDLDRYIVDPLQRMLINATTLENYVLMTASPKKGESMDKLAAEIMMVLVCDRVSSDDYERNYAALGAPADKLSNVTAYPTCALS